MTVYKKFRNMLGKRVSRRGYLLALTGSGLVALVVSLLIAYSVGYLSGAQTIQLQCHGNCPPEVYVESELRSNVNLIHFKICLGFIVSALGLWSRRFVGFLFSLAGLIWVAICYLNWHISTKRFLAEYVLDQTKLEHQYYRHIGLFRDATWWDWMILVITVLLIVWHIKILLTLRAPKRDAIARGTVPQP